MIGLYQHQAQRPPIQWIKCVNPRNGRAKWLRPSGYATWGMISEKYGMAQADLSRAGIARMLEGLDWQPGDELKFYIGGDPVEMICCGTEKGRCDLRVGRLP